MILQDANINSALLRLRREAKGWGQSDLATRACMSIKQIRQLEEGGLSAFYSETVKLTAARKVGTLLGLSPDEVFGETPATDSVASDPYDEVSALRSVSSPVYETEASATAAEGGGVSEIAAPVASTDQGSDEQVPPERRNRNSWGLIVVLFVGAILLAATFRPSEPSPVATEPPPPLQPTLQEESGNSATNTVETAKTPHAPVVSPPTAPVTPVVPAVPAPVTPATTSPSAPAGASSAAVR